MPGRESAMTTTAVTSGTGLDVVAELAAQLRVDSIRSRPAPAPGIRPPACRPPTCWPCWSAATCATTGTTRDWPANDHLIFSKGHASPLLYSVFKAVGVVSDEELMTGYRRFGQRLEGHPTPVLPWVDVATGSLGQGLPDGVGVALAGKYLDRLPYRVWVLCGDSEMAEGSIWEALDKASHYGLVQPDRDRRRQPARAARPDRARLGPRCLRRAGPRRSAPASWSSTVTTWPRSTRAWPRPRRIDGGPAHGHPGQDDQGPRRSPRSRTRNGWHGKPFPPDMADRAIAELGGVRNLVLRGPRPEPAPASARQPTAPQARRRAARVRRSATRWPPARPTATRSSRSAPATRGRRTGRRGQQLHPRRRVRARPTRTGTSRCTSPSSRWWPPPSGWPCAATVRSPRPSPRS